MEFTDAGCFEQPDHILLDIIKIAANASGPRHKYHIITIFYVRFKQTVVFPNQSPDSVSGDCFSNFSANSDTKTVDTCIGFGVIQNQARSDFGLSSCIKPFK